jgi:hypothetical protein
MVEFTLLNELTWPKPANQSSQYTKDIHKWLVDLTKTTLALDKTVITLEAKVADQQKVIDAQKKCIDELKTAQKKAPQGASNLAKSWVTVENKKLPADQMTAIKAMTVEWDDKSKRMKNIAFNGIPKSTKATLKEQQADDLEKVKEVLVAVGMSERSSGNPGLLYARRINQREKDRDGHPISEANRKPTPIIVETEGCYEVGGIEDFITKVTKCLRSSENYKHVFVSKDYTAAESQLNYELRKKRRELNAALNANSVKVWAVVGTRLREVKRRTL